MSLGAELGDGLPADHPAEPRAGDPLGRGAGVRPRGRRVRLGRPHRGQHPVRDRRSPRCTSSGSIESDDVDRRGGGLGRAAGALARRAGRDPRRSAASDRRTPPMVVDRRARIGLRVVALAYLAAAAARPGRARLLPDVRARRRRRLGLDHDARRDPRVLADDRDRAIAVPLNTVFGVVTALALVRGRFRGKALLEAIIDLPFAISPVVIGLALVLVYGRERLVRRVARRPRHPDHLRGARAWCSRRSSCRCRSSCARSTPVLREIGDEQEQAAATLGALALADVLRASRCRRSAGASPTASCSRRRARSASSARSASCRARSPARPRR